MPVYGMPTALESSLNTLLQLGGPTSWRVSAHSEDITVVLRWAASKMWPTSAAPSKEWPAASSKNNWPVTPTPVYSSTKRPFDFNNAASYSDDVFDGDSLSSGSSNKQPKKQHNNSLSKSHSTSSTSSSLSTSSQTHKISSSSKKRKRKHSGSSSCSSSSKLNNIGDRDRSNSRLSTSNNQTPTSSGIHYNSSIKHTDGINSISNGKNSAKSSYEKGTKSTSSESAYSTNSFTASTAGVSDPYPVYITSSESVIHNDLIMQDEIHSHGKTSYYPNENHHHNHHRNDSNDKDCTSLTDNFTSSPDSPENKTDTKLAIIQVSSIYNEAEFVESNNTNNYNSHYQERRNTSNQQHHHHHNHKSQKHTQSSKSSSNTFDNVPGHHHKSAFKSQNTTTKYSHNEKHNLSTGVAQRRDVVSPCNTNFYSVVAKALQKDPETSNNYGSGGNSKKGGQLAGRVGSSKIHRQASFDDNSDMVFVERRTSPELSDDDDQLNMTCSVEVPESSE